MKSILASTRRLLVAAVASCVVLIVPACNDKPTDVGSILVPGTDTLYATSSEQLGFLTAVPDSAVREPVYNTPYVLFGKTSTSEARLFVELTTYPKLGAADSVTLLSADLQLMPQAYVFGDTSARGFSLAAYELQQAWSAQATWDSIWANDGSTVYYSTAQQPIAQYSVGETVIDSVFNVPLDTSVMRRWLTLGMDTSRVDEIFGMVLLPTSTGAIRQYRNLRDQSHVLRVRFVTKKLGDTIPDTTYSNAAVAGFVNSPLPTTDESIVQGARILRAAYQVKLDSLPPLSVLMGSSFRVTVDVNRSTIGSTGLDEILSLRYRAKDGTLLSQATRGNGQGLFVFDNIVAMLQRIRNDGGTGIIEVGPANDNAYWRMNRLWIYPFSEPTRTLVPTMTLIYTVPKELE